MERSRYKRGVGQIRRAINSCGLYRHRKATAPTTKAGSRLVLKYAVHVIISLDEKGSSSSMQLKQAGYLFIYLYRADIQA